MHWKSFCIFTLLAVNGLAQVGGRITGTVKDPTGAAVGGAGVAAVDAGTGVKQETNADDQGMFSFPAIAVGHYNLTVSVPGFTPYRKTGLAIDVNTALQVDVVLQLAGQTTTVEVNEEAAQVQVEKSDTQLGQTVTSQRIEEVPLNGRSYTDLLAVQTGVTPVSTGATSSSSGGGFGAVAPSGGLNPGLLSVNGQRESANGFILNGANVEEGIAEGAAIVPNLDSIAEFRVLTSNFDAEYGNYSGGLISVVTKSGTDQFHGSAFEFLRNTDLDARGFFDPSRAPYIQNQFGGTIGGPIKKDKIFFFGDYQGTRNIQGIGTGLLPVPSVADRSGNFSDLASALSGTVQGAYAASLLSQRLGYGVSAGEAYYTPNCTSSLNCVFPNAVIPQRAWSAPAQNLLQYIPLPNVGASEYANATLAQHLNDGKGSVRVDAPSTRFGAVSVYYFLDDYNLNNPYPTAQGGANVPGFNALSNGQAQLASLSATKSFGPTLVNEVQLSYLRDSNDLGQQQGGVGQSLASQGFTVGPNGILPGDPKTEGVESIVFNKINFGTSPFSLAQTNGSYQVQDNLSKVIGNHTMKFGGQGLLQEVKLLPDFTANGQFQFTGYQTGSDFADFLLGFPNTYNQGFSPAFYEQSKYAGLFAQDSWRLRSNLTFNYGVRWDLIQPWTEEHNQTGTLIPGEQSVVFPGAPTGLVFPGDPNVPRTIAPTRYNNFSPRLGLAWSPNSTSTFIEKLTGGPGNSSIRAGYGRFFTAIEGQTLAFETGNAPYGLTYSSPETPLFTNPLIGAQTGTVYPQEFPVVVPPYNTSAKNPDSNVNFSSYYPINGIDAYFPTNRNPYSENYFLSLERKFGANTVFDASYIGSQAHHQLVLLAANPGNPVLCVSLSQPSEVAPGTQTCGPFGENLTYTRSNGQIVNGTRGPLGNSFGTDVYFDAMGNSDYNSLQVSLKHSGGGFTVLGSYTYAKSLDQASNLGEQVDPYNYRLTRAPSSFDIKNDFVATYRYDFPFDRLLHHADRLTKGWALSGITRFSSGLPVTLVNPNDTSLIGSYNNGVNGIGFGNLDIAPGNLELNGNPRNGQPYFNTALFSLPALGSPGTASRRQFYGPGMDNWDMALLKETHFSEFKVLEFRLETFNTFNHAQFFGANSVDGNINDSTFGQIISANSPRLIQVALKLHF
jgi:hypothetical protein